MLLLEDHCTHLDVGGRVVVWSLCLYWSSQVPTQTGEGGCHPYPSVHGSLLMDICNHKHGWHSDNILTIGQGQTHQLPQIDYIIITNITDNGYSYKTCRGRIWQLKVMGGSNEYILWERGGHMN